MRGTFGGETLQIGGLVQPPGATDPDHTGACPGRHPPLAPARTRHPQPGIRDHLRYSSLTVTDLYLRDMGAW